MIDRAVATLAFFLIGQTPALSASSQNLTLTPDSALWLVGDSTLHPFTSRTSQLQMTAELDPQTVPGDALHAILQKQALKRFDLSIPVNALKSKESGLDKNMYKALKAEACPSIDFRLTHYEMITSTLPTSQSGAAEQPVRASGTLRVACQEKTVTLEANLTPEPAALRIQGQYPLMMTDYGVKPPTIMMGAIKVRDKVVIHYDLRLSSSQPSPPERKHENH